MVNVYILSQNVKLSSLHNVIQTLPGDSNIFVSSNKMFDCEKLEIQQYFSDCYFICFGEILTDEDCEKCDTQATKNTFSVEEYYSEIKRIKNEFIFTKVKEQFSPDRGVVLSNDLGIDMHVWKKHGYKVVYADYYYDWGIESFWNQIIYFIKSKGLFRWVYHYIRNYRTSKTKKFIPEKTNVYVAYDDRMKYIFMGKMDRISYRTNLEWKESKEEKDCINEGKFYKKQECQYLSTLHESTYNAIPDCKEYDVRYIQDGYLPSNYTSAYLCYKPSNVSYYSWDKIGSKIFEHFDLPVSILPFRKTVSIDKLSFDGNVRTILVATSGPGDWTAIKNRSDEDLMAEAFVEIARRHPNINIIYRCHPTWIHPEHNGVHSIERLRQYFKSTGLNNISISTNIPENALDNYSASFPRSSLEDDLKKADIVFGEHSVSMIDAAMFGIPFSSINLTNRRNLFSDISEFGFPHCESIDDIDKVICEYSKKSFLDAFNDAIDRYNYEVNCE